MFSAVNNTGGGYADTMGRLRVTTNTADAFGLMLLLSPDGDWIIASERDAAEGKARILVDWDRDGTVKQTEQDDARKTDPGLILAKSDTTPVLLGFETLPLGASFSLILPEDQSLIKVKVNDEYEFGTVTGLTTSSMVTVESANNSFGTYNIIMDCGGARDVLKVVVGTVDILIDWDKDGVVETEEQDEPRETDPGLTIDSSENYYERRIFTISCVEATQFLLHLDIEEPANLFTLQWSEYVSEEWTEWVPLNLDANGDALIDAEDNENNRYRIVPAQGATAGPRMLEAWDPAKSGLFDDVKVYTVDNDNNLHIQAVDPKKNDNKFIPTGSTDRKFQAVRGGAKVVCDWMLHVKDGSAATLQGEQNGWASSTDTATLNAGNDPCQNVDGVVLYAREDKAENEQTPPAGDNAIEEADYRFTIYGIDVDIDSDNNNVLDLPERSQAEDDAEETAPGKYIDIHNNDYDCDGIPDFADGYNLDGTPGNDDDTNALDLFVPLIVELPPCTDLNKAKIRFTYDASDPAGVTREGTSPNIIYNPPASGRLRIWIKDACEERSKASVKATTLGDYVPGDTFDVSQLGFAAENLVITLYVEGIVPSTALGSDSIVVEVDPDGPGPADFISIDTVVLTIFVIDLDVDSDNNNALDAPDRNLLEDHFENILDDPARPGKIVVINDNDVDNDGVPDFADGYNLDGINNNEDDEVSYFNGFTPLIIEVPAPIDLTKIKIIFAYSGSDPAGVTRTGNSPDFIYTPQSGNIRIWIKNKYLTRNMASVIAGTPGDYVPPNLAIPASSIGLAGATRTVTLYIEGINGSSDIGSTLILVYASPEGATEGDVWYMTDEVRVTVMELDLDADTNRDNSIDQLDEPYEGWWRATGTTKHAIILPNCDKDSGAGTVGPDNWPGGADWDIDGTNDPANTTVDAGNDKDDIGPLYIPKFGPAEIPDNLKITLTVGSPEFLNPYFDDVDPQNIARIFLPTDTDNDDYVIKEGDEEIIGPTKGDSVEFVKSPGANQRDISIFEGSGTVKFGIEGIEMGAEVKIKMTVEIGTITLITDTVVVKVAPFILCDHSQEVKAAGDGEVVYVLNMGADNADMRTDMTDLYDPGAPGGADDRLYEINAADGDGWQQDCYEIGYAKAPGNKQIFVVLVSPRARRGAEAYWKPRLRHLRTSARLLKDGVGNCWKIDNLQGIASGDSFGNLECKPQDGKPGKHWSGKNLNANICEFLEAQLANYSYPRITNVNTEWLSVGHVDEVISFAPDKEHIVVADPEVASALLLWAKSIDAAATMLQGMQNWDLTGTYPDPGGISVANVLTLAKLRSVNLSLNANDDPDAFVMTSGNLPQVRQKAGAESPESDVTRVQGTGTLAKGGALVAFFPNDKVRTYRIEFTNATDYMLKYKEAGDATWTDDGGGSISDDKVFTNALCFIYSHWWSGTFQGGGQKSIFEFTANPTSDTVEIPVLFNYVGGGAYRQSFAFTADHVNCLVDGATVLTAKAYGPQVAHPNRPPGAAKGDILWDYTEKALMLAGYTTVKGTDSRVYHNGTGNVHCGTNVRRTIPTYNWWEFEE